MGPLFRNPAPSWGYGGGGMTWGEKCSFISFSDCDQLNHSSDASCFMSGSNKWVWCTFIAHNATNNSAHMKWSCWISVFAIRIFIDTGAAWEQARQGHARGSRPLGGLEGWQECLKLWQPQWMQPHNQPLDRQEPPLKGPTWCPSNNHDRNDCEALTNEEEKSWLLMRNKSMFTLHAFAVDVRLFMM